jgi:hypothetical protein
MDNISPIFYLDKVLYSFEPNNRNRGVHNLDISNNLATSDTKINRSVLTEILFKLVKDGYLRIEVDDAIINYQTVKNIDFYLLTLEGEIFQLSGGYIKQIETTSKNENRRLSYDRRLIWGTWFAGIAAILVLLWQVWLWFYPLRKDFVHRNDIEKISQKS